MIELRAHFRDSNRHRLREWHRQQRHMEQTRRDDQKRRDDAAEELESDLLTAASTILATPQEIEAFAVRLDDFETRLDTYDKATVKALLESQQRLEAYQLERANMLDQAYVMENGRRVFRSEDGSYYMDEDRNAVDPNDLDLSRFTDAMPSAEDFIRIEDNILREQTVQQNIHDFDAAKNKALDRAEDIRTEIEKGGMTKERLDELADELDRMDKDLLQIMPPSVRAHVPGLGLDADTPDMKAGFNNVAASSAAFPPAQEINNQPALAQ